MINLVFLDLEMAQPSNKIIQIGYLVANPEDGTVHLQRRIYVNPQEILSPEITKLTGITQEQVDSAGTLQEAYQVLASDLKEQRETFGREIFLNPVTWGGGDSSLLREQLGMDDDRFVFGRRWIDAKTLFVGWAIANGIKPMGGLANSMKRLKLKFVGRKHDALDDAYNTMLIFQKLLTFLRAEKA